MILTEQYKANRERVFELVKNFFGYSQESVEKFKEMYWERERFIDETYKKLFNEEMVDFKIRRKITDDIMKRIDSGFLLFNLWFSAFCQKYDITYENFKSWKIEINKNSFKLQKALVNFYSDKKNYIPYAADIRIIRDVDSFKELRDKEEQIKRQLQSIQESVSERKLPNQDLEFVISFDFADWFLASTAETWSSCLNLRSTYNSCFWHGLPALIGDSNRCMVYMTNKDPKEFLGIKADKIISRAWGELGEDNIVYFNKSYPSTQFSYDDMEIMFPELKFGSIIELSQKRVVKRTKNPITPLWLPNDESDFIFNDLSTFRDDMKIDFGYIDGGHRVLYKKKYGDKEVIEVVHRDHFSWTRGFEEIYKTGKDIISIGAHRSIRKCFHCGKFKRCEYQLSNGSYVCSDCYHQLPACSCCGRRDVPESLIEFEGKLYCKHCFEREFRICSCCGRKGPKSEFVSNSLIPEIVCKKCGEKFYHKCPKCSSLTRIDKMKINNGKACCEYCNKEEE